MRSGYVIELLSVTLLVVWSIVVSVRGQPLPSCRASVDCNGAPGDDLGVVAEPRDCCLGIPNGLAYVPRQGACIACVVVGFFNTTFSGVEQGPVHLIPVGYQKGAATARQNLVFNVVNTPGTAKVGPQFDYIPNTMRVRALYFSAATPDNVVVTFRVDAIAQEPNETFTLTLNPVIQPTQRDGLFFLNTSQVTIVDNDNVQFAFTEDDFRALEPDNNGGDPTTLPVIVTKSARIARRVELMVIPYTVQEAILQSVPLPPNIPPDDPHSPPYANLEDFNNTNITIVFEPDEDAEVVISEIRAPIFVTDDDINEANEQVFVVELVLIDSLDPASVDLTIRPASLCRIIDNDPIRIGFEFNRYTYDEPQFDSFTSDLQADMPNLTLIYLVKEDNVISEQTFLFSIQVTDSPPPDSSIQAATFRGDYRFGSPGVPSETQPFMANEQRMIVDIELLSDASPEGTEAFRASVSPESMSSDGTQRYPNFLNPINTFSEAFVVILDDDPIIIGFTNTSYTVDEGVGTLQVEVQVFSPPDEEDLPAGVSLVIQSVSGSAIGGSDYEEISAATLDVFLSFDDINRRQSFNVTIIDDSEFEFDIENFTLELRFDPFLPPPSGLILCPNVSTLEILDNDSVVIGFLNTPYTVGESDIQANIQIGVIRGALRRAVTIQFSTSADSADAGSDYSESVGVQLIFDSATREVDVSVPLVGDNIFELTELFSASLAFSGAPPPGVFLAPDSAQVTILDDDVLTFGFEPVEYDVGENDRSANLSIFFMSGDPREFVPHVNASTIDETATGSGSETDYISVVEQSVFFTTANRIQNFTVQIVSDDFTELNESFSARLTSVFLAHTAGGAAISLSDQERTRLILNPDTATVTIRDDDEAVIGFVNTDLSIFEDGGELEFEIAVLQGNLRINVLVGFVTADGSAVAGLDYETTTRSLIFIAQSRQPMLVHIINDSLFEDPKNFFGHLSAGGVLPLNVHLVLIQAIATIVDDDSIVIGFDPDIYSVNEPDRVVALRVRVLLGNISQGRDILVRVATADGSAQASSDYGAISQVLTFSSSVTLQTMNVSIMNDDLLGIDEVFTASIALVNATDAARVDLQPNSTDVTILDEDMAMIGFVPDLYSVVEGTDQFSNLTVQLISGQLGREVILTFDTQSGSATSGLDYVAVLNQQLTFGPNMSSHTVHIQIPDDNSFEKNTENFTATLSTINIVPRFQLGDRLATVNISDNEVVRIGFESAQYSASEASTIANTRIEVSGGLLEREIIVNFSTSDSTAIAGEDYVGLISFLLTFDSSNAVDVVPLVILDDEADENTETMSASLSFPGLPLERVFLEPNTTVIQIHDDDDADIGFISPHLTVRESDGQINIQVGVLSGSLRKEVALYFFVTELNALVGEDYHKPQTLGATLNFTTNLQINIPIINDEVFELSESFFVNLSLVGGSTSQNSTEVIILDDDELVFGFTPSKYEIHESEGPIIVNVFFINGNPGNYQPLVLISTHNGTATEGTDFDAISSSQVSFTVSNRANTLAIPVISSNSTERSEEFSVTFDEVVLIHRNNRNRVSLSDQERARLILNPRRANITILDDNVAIIGFLNTNLSIFEGEVALNFTIGVIQGYLDTFVTVSFTTEEATAKAGVDYSINTSKLLNFTGDSVHFVSVQVFDDGISEPQETFFGLLSIADGMTIPPNIRLEPTRATVTIVNDNDLTKSEESNSTIILLAVVFVCTLAFLALITAASIVMCFVYKKKSKRKIVNMEEHVYESVSLPPTTLVTFSEPAKLECDLYDEVNTASGSTTAEFELTDNEAYSSSMPPTAAEIAPNTDQTESADL